MNILLGVTGSVASKLTPKIYEKLCVSHDVKIVATKSSYYFWNKEDVKGEVLDDEDEWQGDGYMKDSPIAHIELREWADVLLIAPVTANTIAKIAHGLADNLLTCITRAWNLEKVIMMAPAMNTKMWEHPITNDHFNLFRRYYKLHIIEPIAKKLACGETGKGAMASIETIVETMNALEEMFDENEI